MGWPVVCAVTKPVARTDGTPTPKRFLSTTLPNFFVPKVPRRSIRRMRAATKSPNNYNTCGSAQAGPLSYTGSASSGSWQHIEIVPFSFLYTKRAPGHRLHTQHLKRSPNTSFYSSAHDSDATSVLSNLVLGCRGTAQKVGSFFANRGVRGAGFLHYCRISATDGQPAAAVVAAGERVQPAGGGGGRGQAATAGGSAAGWRQRRC